MTAVATFPSVPRAGWPNSSQSTLNQMSPDEVARLFMPRKGSQRGAPQGSEGGGVWGNGQIRGGTAGHDVGQAGGVGNLKNKKTTRGAPWSQKGDMLRGPGIGTHSTSSSLSSSPTMNGIHQKTPMLPSQHRGSQPSPLIGGDNSGTSFLMLLPLNNSFETKLIPLPYYPDTLRIGRQTNAKTLPNPTNGYFDSKVLSRQHAEVWAEPNTGKVWIRDVKSSNGTFVNGTRLSQENRDSEPHELRTDDVLELGIDIFSEDNKSIIHHKVAAKVEHAGFQNGQMNLELNNLGEMDPIMGGGLISPQLKQVNNNFARGRSASQNSRAGSVAGGGGGMMQRGAPVFIQSVSVEQIVKRLNSELHAAKQQAQELQRTQEFFDHLLNLEVVRKEPEIKKAEVVESAGQSPMIDSGVALDAGQFQNMSHHPLPPPAKHITVIPEVEKSELEEKPPVHDISPPSPVSPPLKRSPKNTMTEPPQHLFSLVAQLRDARLELEAKSMRVKDLEDLLRREREAREMAEAQLQMASHMATEADRTENSEEDDIPDDVSVAGSDITVVDVKDHVQSQENDIQSAAAATAAANAATEAAAMLQKKLEEMMAQLKAAQAEIETYKKRVKAAEEEGQQSKRTLMEMVAKIRADEEKRQKEMKETSVQTERKNADGSLRGKPVMVSCGVQAEVEQVEEDEGEVFPGAIANGTVKAVNGPLVIGGGKQLQNRHRDQEQQQQLQQNLSTEMVKKAGEKRNMVKESVPYMSIVGVVVIGVSIMAILNNWQKGER